MSDIVERLRKGHAIYDYDDDCLAAAAEIESLRSRLAEVTKLDSIALCNALAKVHELEAALAYAASTGDECAVEVEALRTELAAARGDNNRMIAENAELRSRLAEADALRRDLVEIVRTHKARLAEAEAKIAVLREGVKEGHRLQDERDDAYKRMEELRLKLRKSRGELG